MLMNTTCASTPTAVADFDDIQTILAAMKRCPSDQAVIRYGFGALSNVVIGNEANANHLVVKLGGIPFLLERMKEFRAEADVTTRACSMLLSLSDFEHLRKPIVNAKAITALAYAIERHGDEPSVQEYARKAMKQLM
jgi:hypothetical protein